MNSCQYPDHKPSTGYAYGCRCPRCREAQRTRQAEARARKRDADSMRRERDEAKDITPEITVPIARITSIEDMCEHLKLDLDRFDVKRYWVGVQERRDGPAFKVSAQIEPKPLLDTTAGVDALFDAFLEMVEAHGPDESVLPQPEPRDEPDPQMMEVILVDPHLGMLAWGKEVLNPYDLDIGLADYKRAWTELLTYAERYNIEELLVHVGHDLFHVDGTMEGGKGATTTKGTQQDFDTRLARLFVHVEQLIVDCIEDAARHFPKVTVQMTPGNHDRHTVYKLGRVLNAWFRQIDHVEIRNKPSVRDYYLYGANVFMFTHGEEFNRNRDNLATIFATECPPEMWVRGKVREIHVGHNHINKQKVWDGKATQEIWEGRAIRARSLPGLTPEDAWHFESGYKHQRRGTVMVWHQAGGLAGLHEVTL